MPCERFATASQLPGSLASGSHHFLKALVAFEPFSLSAFRVVCYRLLNALLSRGFQTFLNCPSSLSSGLPLFLKGSGPFRAFCSFLANTQSLPSGLFHILSGSRPFIAIGFSSQMLPLLSSLLPLLKRSGPFRTVCSFFSGGFTGPFRAA